MRVGEDAAARKAPISVDVPKLAPAAVGCSSAAASAKAPIRLELQGLRAIAILQVLLYHLWPSIFAGGYLGVDL